MVALNAKEKGCVVTLLDKEVKDLIWIWLVEIYDINYLIMVMIKKDVWSREEKKMYDLHNFFFFS